MFADKLKLFYRSMDNIWTDPHVSGNMLKAHLATDSDAASRNIGAIRTTVAWISSLTAPGQRLLDLGCGPGLYTELFHDHGLEVTGVDISETSIAYARENAARLGKSIRYFRANYLQDPIDGLYDVATCIYCDFGALVPEEQHKFLDVVRDRLVPGGFLVFDVFGEGLCGSRKEGRSWTCREKGGFWNPGPHFELNESVHFKDAKAWGERTIIIAESVREYVTWDSYFTKDGIADLLRNHGFRLESARTDLVPSSDFTSDDVMFVVARKEA